MLYILLPAYNEEADIGALFRRIQDAMQTLEFPDYKVLVVDDGSTDGTVSIINEYQKDMSIEILSHKTNLGLGQAMLTGLRRAVGIMADEDILVSMDADNTHDPFLIGPMAEKIHAGADLVIASRYAPGGEEIGLSLRRKLLSRGASELLMIFFPLRHAKDYTCGFRAYRGAALKAVFQVYGKKLIEEQGFTCMAEILIKMRAVRARVTEVPLVLRYDLKSGKSKILITRTILRYFILIARNLFLHPPFDSAAPGQSGG